jgi:hypothetical protein
MYGSGELSQLLARIQVRSVNERKSARTERSRLDKVLLTAILVLALAASAQLIGRIANAHAANDPPLLLAGDIFPVVPMDGRGHPLPEPVACVAMWVIDPRCPGCRELAKREPRTEGYRWLLAGPRREREAFVQEFGLDSSVVLYVPNEDADPKATLREIGIYATPSRLILDSGWRVLEISVIRESMLSQTPTKACEDVQEKGNGTASPL